MSDAIKYFLEGFLNKSSEIMDKNTADADDLKDRERTAADRNIGVYNKRKGVADAVFSAAKGLKNDGASLEMIKLAISEQGGIVKLREKLAAAKTFWGDNWTKDKAKDYVGLPEEFLGNTLLTDGSVTLKDFIYDTYNLTSSKLGDYQPLGETSFKDRFFNTNAKERARMELDKESMQGELSVFDVNKAAALPEFESLIGGSYLNYKDPKFINDTVVFDMSDALTKIRRDYMSDPTTALALRQLAQKQSDYLVGINTSAANQSAYDAQLKTYEEIMAERGRLELGLKGALTPRIDNYKKVYGEENFNDEMGSLMPNLYSLSEPVAEPGEIVESESVLDQAAAKALQIKEYNVSPVSGGTQNNYKYVVARDATGSGEGLVKKGDILHVKVIDGITTLEHLRGTAIIATRTGQEALELITSRNMSWDSAQELLTPKVNIPKTNVASEVSDAAKASLTEFINNLGLQPTVNERTRENRKFYTYEGSVDSTGTLSKDLLKNAVNDWGRTWNSDNPTDKIDLIGGIGKTSLPGLTDLAFNLITSVSVVEEPVVEPVVSSESDGPANVERPLPLGAKPIVEEPVATSSVTPLKDDKAAAQEKALFSRDPDVVGLGNWEKNANFGRLKKTTRNLTTRNTAITSAITRYLKDRDGGKPSREAIEALAQKYIKALKMGIYD